MHPILRIGTLLCLCLLVTPGIQHAAGQPVTAEQEAQLEKVRKKLERLREKVDKDIRKRDASTRKLRDIENEIARASSELLSLRRERAASEARQREINREQAERQRMIVAERASLAGQLRSAYINGRQERLKLTLNQQDPAGFGRSMVYYDYLNRYRTDKIAAVTEHLRELDRLAAAAAEESRRLAALEKKKVEALAALDLARKERAKVVAALEAEIKTNAQEIARLEEQEKALEELIEQLRRAMLEFPAQTQEPFQNYKGKLTWPVQGTLVSDFGQARAGHLKWNGVLLAAARGAEVRAIFHGRVAYADWLPGLGLLVVVEHGDGYMSLYGHNETIFKSAGDWVSAGDVVATVGDSGGRSVPALYFEIRRGKTPLNPHAWIGKRPRES